MHKRHIALKYAAAVLASTAMAAAANSAPELTLQLHATKGFQFSWTAEPYTTHYRLLEDPSGKDGFTAIAKIAATSTSFEHIVPLHQRVNARYIVQACDELSCTDSNTVHASAPLTEAIGYIKASNVDAQDKFGSAVALSADGSTLAVAAFGEQSNATGVNGNQSDNSAPVAGAVYVFVRTGNGSAWTQQAYIKGSNTDAEDAFGWALALSANGSTLAVSARGEGSNATGVNGNQLDDSAPDAGAVYVYTRVNSHWAQQAYIKASNTYQFDRFGTAVALSGDGNILAVGASHEDSGVRGNPFDNSAPESGAVYVFGRIGSSWAQRVYLKASNPGVRDFFGSAIDLSDDGRTLAVGAPFEDSSATAVNGDQTNNNATDAGAAYVFVNLGAVWAQHSYIKAANTDPFDYLGAAVSLSGNGALLAVGAPGEDSSATGVMGDLFDNSASAAGAAYVFGLANSRWTQHWYFKASTTEANDAFGHSVALSNDGATLAVGALGEDSNAVGINGDETGDPMWSSGAAYAFVTYEGFWMQSAYVKASNTMPVAFFGNSLALAGNGGTLAVGASNEKGSASGVNGPQVTPPLAAAGAVYVY